jgi:curved DNA-binding protein CbpA
LYCAAGASGHRWNRKAEMTGIPDYYAALCVQQDATRQQISRAYRALMRNHHPDLDAARTGAGPDKGNAKTGAPPESELLRIMQAFAVLRDPARRAAYDREVRAAGAGLRGSATATEIPVRKVRPAHGPTGNTIRISPVHWESGPWT